MENFSHEFRFKDFKYLKKKLKKPLKLKKFFCLRNPQSRKNPKKSQSIILIPFVPDMYPQIKEPYHSGGNEIRECMSADDSSFFPRHNSSNR